MYERVKANDDAVANESMCCFILWKVVLYIKSVIKVPIVVSYLTLPYLTILDHKVRN